MIAKLERLIGEIGDLNSKLVLLTGPSRNGNAQLLRRLGSKLNIAPLNVGLELGRRLAATSVHRTLRHRGQVPSLPVQLALAEGQSRRQGAEPRRPGHSPHPTPCPRRAARCLRAALCWGSGRRLLRRAGIPSIARGVP